MITLSIKIKENTQELTRLILNALRDDITKFLSGVANNGQSKIQDLIRHTLLNCPEMIDAKNGDLRSELGLENAEQKIDGIINVWVNNIVVTPKQTIISGNGLNAGFTLGIIRSDFSDVLSQAEAVQITEKGQDLPWLRWLLLDGTGIIIDDYDLKIKPDTSRTGKYIMVPSSRYWGVPYQYAGTIDNNFVTRALDGIKDQIDEIIYGSLRA
jgi:hypothetical protein